VFLLDQLPQALAMFTRSMSGESKYEYALVAALAAVVGIIVLIAVTFST
jgi:Flp pilus assembly pilin Flp